jgi:hypothetical protein
LADNLDELSDRLTPGQVIDEMLTYSKANGGTAFRAFSNVMRENPLPSLLIGAGCMMFLSEKMGSSASSGRAASSDPNWVSRIGEAQSSHSAMSAVRSAAASASNRSGVARASGSESAQASNVADTVRQGATATGDKASAAADATRIMAHDWRDRASDAAARARQNAGDTIGAVRDYSSSLGERVTDAADRKRRQAADRASRARAAARSFVSDQPLLCAALGIAVGAAIASLLPRTSQEDQLMGATSDAVKEATSQVASEQRDAAKETAARVVHKARDAAEEDRLTPTALAQAPHNPADRIRKGSSEFGAAESSTEQTGLENLS